MDDKIEIHKRLGVSAPRTDEIIDGVVAAFAKNDSPREMVEFVNNTYDSESVIAGITMNTALTEFFKEA